MLASALATDIGIDDIGSEVSKDQTEGEALALEAEKVSSCHHLTWLDG